MPYKLKQSRKKICRLLELMILFVIMICYMISISGCAVGIKEKDRIIYARYAKMPQELDGGIQIATNQEIPVTIVGKKDVQTKMDLGGYVAINPYDLEELLEEVQNR